MIGENAGKKYLIFFWIGEDEILTLASQKGKEDPPEPRLRRASTFAVKATVDKCSLKL